MHVNQTVSSKLSSATGSMKAAKHSTGMSKYSCVPINFIHRNRQRVKFRQSATLLSPGLTNQKLKYQQSRRKMCMSNFLKGYGIETWADTENRRWTQCVGEGWEELREY